MVFGIRRTGKQYLLTGVEERDIEDPVDVVFCNR